MMISSAVWVGGDAIADGVEGVAVDCGAALAAGEAVGGVVGVAGVLTHPAAYHYLFFSSQNFFLSFQNGYSGRSVSGAISSPNPIVVSIERVSCDNKQEKVCSYVCPTGTTDRKA